MGSDEYSSIQETREAPRLTAQQQLNKRERERRRRTAQAFENIRELLGVSPAERKMRMGLLQCNRHF